MTRLLLTLGFLVLWAGAAFSQAGPPQFVAQMFTYKHITTDATTVVKQGPGLLGDVCINTPAAGETITIYDNTAGSGTVIAVITESATTMGCFYYNVVFKTGLTLVTAVAAGDLTAMYQ